MWGCRLIFHTLVIKPSKGPFPPTAGTFSWGFCHIPSTKTHLNCSFLVLGPFLTSYSYFGRELLGRSLLQYTCWLVDHRYQLQLRRYAEMQRQEKNIVEEKCIGWNYLHILITIKCISAYLWICFVWVFIFLPWKVWSPQFTIKSLLFFCALAFLFFW